MKRNAATFLIGSLGLNLARLIREFLVIAALVDPAAAAAWVTVSLVRQYGAFSDLGASNALARLLPEALAKSPELESRRLAGTALSLSFINTVGLALVAYVIAAAVAPGSPVVATAPWLLGMLILDKVFLVQTTVQRSRQQWGAVTGQYLALGILELALGAWGARQSGLTGALLGTVVAQGIVAIVFWASASGWLKPTWDKTARRKMASLGWVLLGFGLTNIAMHSVDRVVLVASGAPSSLLASYHLAAYASIAVAQVAGGIMGVYSSRMFRASADETDRYARALGFPVYGMTAIGLVTGLLALPALTVVLPLIGRGAPLAADVIVVLLATEVLICWTMPMENALVGLNRGGWALPARFVGVAVGIIGGLYAFQSGLGAVGVAMARLGGQAVVSSVVLWLASRATRVPPFRPIASFLAPVGLVATGLALAASAGSTALTMVVLGALWLVLALTVLWTPARAWVESLVRAVPG
ncbi:MAG: oligosaccharide flippase family protein [Fimbriimonadaceae bacterium]|nr:oligosaccharide flippase family protein [Fimbriimonadaceae bacterium]QYK59257.1 MAG: oligosaccharide flippase family protein [Fimbriimonadaceae bacterium]